MVDGELVGTWRRRLGRVLVRAWRKIEADTKSSIESEAQTMPVESPKKEVRWAPCSGTGSKTVLRPVRPFEDGPAEIRGT